jgi:uncharacterized membrane protein SirB2
MSRLYLLQSVLTLHLIGLVIMAGTTIVDYLTFKTFWNLVELEKEKSRSLLQVMSRYSRLIGIGAALLILTGLGMMVITGGVFGEQWWFRIKFALVILLVLNGVFIGRRQGSRLRKLIVDSGFDLTRQTTRLRSNLNRFYLTQLAIFLVIIFLSVFKFN